MQDTVRPTRDRRILLDGAINVRDIGGYPTHDGRRTRWHTLLRADSLHRLTESDRTLLGETYGVRTIVDLRRASELDSAPNVYADHAGFRHLPIFDDAPAGPARTLDAIYRAILDSRQASIAAVMRALIVPGALPVIIHCTAGKDRTGVVIALLLAHAGVSDSLIAEDYAVTAATQTERYFSEARGRAEAAGINWADYQRLLVCPPGLMIDTLDYLRDRYGSASRYLAGRGLSADELTILRDALTEPA